MNLRRSKKEDNNLPEFSMLVSSFTRDNLILQFKDNVTTFAVKDGYINGWELDDYMTKCIGNLTGTVELRNALAGKDPIK